MAQVARWTSADLEVMPEDGKRYEIIDGDLYVSRATGAQHQLVSAVLIVKAWTWNAQTRLGYVLPTPDVIFADDDDVIPDLVWISRERFGRGLDRAGHLTVAPELVIEVLSPGDKNERRDREAKVKLYGRRGVNEYWIVDWLRRQVGVYRRADPALKLITTLRQGESLSSPLLPGFACPVADLFADLPED